jgi:hypothetical protein
MAVLSQCVALLALGNPPASLRDIAYARGNFESLVTSEKLYVMMMNSNGFNAAYYPVGVSKRRYVIDFGAGRELIFQELWRGVPKTIWRLELQEQTGKKGGHGTLRRILAQSGLRVKSRRLTRAQQAALSASVNFADYSLMAQTDFLRVAFVRKDGTEPMAALYDPNPIRLKAPFLPIPAEESRLLGLGAKEWHGPGKFDIMNERR